MIILKHGKKPEPKRWKFRCKLCGCEWIADETEAECWLECDGELWTATSRCPTCNETGYNLCEVEPDEYNKIFEQVEMPLLHWKHFRLTT